jgi:hypothetical protein
MNKALLRGKPSKFKKKRFRIVCLNKDFTQANYPICLGCTLSCPAFNNNISILVIVPLSKKSMRTVMAFVLMANILYWKEQDPSIQTLKSAVKKKRLGGRFCFRDEWKFWHLSSVTLKGIIVIR